MISLYNLQVNKSSENKKGCDSDIIQGTKYLQSIIFSNEGSGILVLLLVIESPAQYQQPRSYIYLPCKNTFKK